MTKLRLKTLLLAVLGMWMAGSAWAADYYVVGNATVGWTGETYHRTPAAMVNVSDNVWVWTGYINKNDGTGIRFRITDGGWGGYWATSDGDLLGTEEKSLKNAQDGGDFSFTVSEEGIYKVTVNTSELKIKAEKMTEPSKDGDYYQIATVNDYYWYAGTVTSGEQNLKGRLTADLDFDGAGFFPLACDKYKFKGEFDGGGHIMKNMVIIGENNNLGLTRYATGGTNIHDLVIEGSFTGSVKVGGFVGFARDGGEITLTNVINKVNVRSTGGSDGNEGNTAGLVACAVDGTKIIATNCANMGEVKGQNGQCSAFIGWSQTGTTFTNCWNSGTINNIESSAQLYRNSGAVTAKNCFDLTTVGNQGTKVDAAKLATGEFCFMLNGDQTTINWYQNLSGTVDANPVPFSSHAQVYANGTLKCDGTSAGGELTYSNESSSVVPPHTFVGGNGWCTVCHTLDQNYLTADTEGFYSIGNANDLKWFAEYVNLGHNTINGKLTADISDYGNGPMIGNADDGSHAYKGTFDGQGHKVTLALNRSENHGALFMYLYSGAKVRNLITDGTITMTEGKSHGSGIFSGSRGETLVENCVSYVTITSDKDGDATIGGIGAFMFDNGTIRNCAFLGTITAGNADGNAGILGYANGGSRVHVQNCYVYASLTVKFTNNSNKIIGRGDPTIVNCYYVGSMGNMQNFMGNDNTTAQATEASEDQMRSGELAFLLNQNQSTNVVWYQVIGTDAKPLPYAKNGGVVYANGALYCDGTAKPESTYSNVQEQATQDDHTYNDWGFCSRCDAFQPDFASQDNDGYYLLDNAKKINWFAVLVDGRETLPAITATPTAKAKLTEDIDFLEDLGNDYQNYNFPGIGTSTNKYHGIFDGQGHVISHLNMNRSGENAVGFFRYVTSGGTVIKRFTLDNTCSFSGNAGVGAFVGRAEGQNGNNDLLFEELGNEASVTASGANGGGILGVDMYSHAVITMKNCYNAGTISSGNEGGGISGWLGDNAVLTNVYNMGTVVNGDKFARGGSPNKTNCHDNETDYADGTVFAALFDYNDNDVNGNVWRMEFSGTPHPVLYDAAIVYKEDFPNRPVAQENVDVTLYRTIKAGTWNTFCAPFAVPTSQFTKVVELDTNNPDTEVLHFITASTIEAGKAYLVKTENAISEINASNVTVSPTITSSTAGGYAFTGVYSPTPLPQDAYVFTTRKSDNKDVIIKVDQDTNMNGFRAYLHATGSNARATSFVIDDEITGIITIDGEVIENGKMYNLGGQRVNEPQHGLYIQNGKKVIR